MIQDMHRSENQAYPLCFLSSPLFPVNLQGTVPADNPKVVTVTDTVRFLAHMILSYSCKHDTVMLF